MLKNVTTVCKTTFFVDTLTIEVWIESPPLFPLNKHVMNIMGVFQQRPMINKDKMIHYGRLLFRVLSFTQVHTNIILLFLASNE